MFSLTLSSKEEQNLEKYIIRELLEKIFNNLVRKRDIILSEIIQDLKPTFYNSPEIISLKEGKLRYELGLGDDIYSILDEILNTIINNSRLNLKLFNKSVIIEFSILRRGYRDILSLKGSEFISKNGYIIKWLEWLLTRGDDIVVINYVVKTGNYHSKTGRAIMIKKVGGEYRIPPEFSGIDDNNFLVRAFSSIEQILDKAIGGVI